MRLVEVRIQNFRAFNDEVSIPISQFTTLVGRNDSGKSSILEALAIFFDDMKVEQGDACVYGSAKETQITCVFDDVPDAIDLDAGFSTSLANEYLLNNDGQLEIIKCYSTLLKSPKLCGAYLKANHPTAARVGDLHQLKNAELKRRLHESGIENESVDVHINASIRKCIWESTEDLEVEPTLIPIDLDEAKEAKKIWKQLSRHLPAFALFRSDRPSTDQDAEAQDPLKAAVKEAIKMQEASLRAVTEAVEREVTEIARATVEEVRKLNPNLAGALNPTFKIKNWDTLFGVSLTGEDDIPINKRGSGTRRLILISFFRAEAERDRSSVGAPGVIYAVEEPETSQHPDNQRMLMRAFSELGEDPNCQVLLTTHTPMLGSLVPLESLRYLQVHDDGTRQIHRGDEGTYDLVVNALGVLPDNRVKIFIAVEGINDINFLSGVSSILHASDSTIPDLSSLEKAGQVVFIPLGGGNLKWWTNRLQELRRAEFHLYDRDTPPLTGQHQTAADKVNEAGGGRCKAILTGRREIENYIHPTAIKQELGIEVEFQDTCDVPRIVAEALHLKNGGETPWSELAPEKQKEKEGRAKKKLCGPCAQRMTPALIDEQDSSGDIRSWLLDIAQLMATVE